MTYMWNKANEWMNQHTDGLAPLAESIKFEQGRWGCFLTVAFKPSPEMQTSGDSGESVEASEAVDSTSQGAEEGSVRRKRGRPRKVQP